LSKLGYRTVPALYEALRLVPEALADVIALDKSATERLKRKLLEIAPQDIKALNRVALANRQRRRVGGVLSSRRSSLSDRLAKAKASGRHVSGSSDSRHEVEKPSDDDCTGLISKMPAIKNQGDRGTCVAFAVLRCFEVLLSDGEQSIETSEQFTYWNIKEIDGIEEEGSSLEHGISALQKTGVCIEKHCRYRSTRYTQAAYKIKQAGPQPSDNASNDASLRKLQDARILIPTDVRALQKYLEQGKPVAFTIPIFRSWELNRETERIGLVRMRIGEFDPVVEYHAITLVGFAASPKQPGGGYFIFDNSWGTSWASENPHFGAGRGMLPYAYVQQHCQNEEAYVLLN